MTLKRENLWGQRAEEGNLFSSVQKVFLIVSGDEACHVPKGESGALERKCEQLRSMFGRRRKFKTVLIMHGLHRLSEPRGYLFTRSFIYSFKQRQRFEKLGLFNCNVAD